MYLLLINIHQCGEDTPHIYKVDTIEKAANILNDEIKEHSLGLVSFVKSYSCVEIKDIIKLNIDKELQDFIETEAW